MAYINHTYLKQINMHRDNNFYIDAKIVSRNNTRYVGERKSPIRDFTLQAQQDQIHFELKFKMYELFDDFIREGNYVRVHFKIHSREYQGKWYTDLLVFQVEQLNKNDFEY